MARTIASGLDSVEALIDIFDGGADGGAAIRRAVLRATAHLAPDHPARDAIDIFHGDVKFYGLSLLIAGGDEPTARRLLRKSWQQTRALIERGWLH